MSWLYSRALVEEFLAENSLDGEQSAPSNSTHMPLDAWWHGRTTDACPLSRFGMMSGRLTGDRGEAVLMSFLAGFPVSGLVEQPEEEARQTTSGRICDELCQMFLQGLFSPKTSVVIPLSQPGGIWLGWVTPPVEFPYQRQTWALTIFGSDFGFMHTPTCTANYGCPSMQKWPSCRNFIEALGQPSPENHEHLMGWPEGWSDLSLPATDRFRLWQQQHFLSESSL